MDRKVKSGVKMRLVYSRSVTTQNSLYHHCSQSKPPHPSTTDLQTPQTSPALPRKHPCTPRNEPTRIDGTQDNTNVIA